MKQRYRHDPANGVWGDCHRAAWASMLELALDEVPHFYEGGPSPAEFNRRESEFLNANGFVAINVAYVGDRNSVQWMMKCVNPGVYYLLSGTSRNGCNHSVVCLNDEIVHDPSLNDVGIVAPCKEDGLYWVTFLGSAAALAKPRDGG